MANISLKKQWRSLVVRKLTRQGLLTVSCQIKQIAHCGTLHTTCGRQIKSRVPFSQFESLHAF